MGARALALGVQWWIKKVVSWGLFLVGVNALLSVLFIPLVAL